MMPTRFEAILTQWRSLLHIYREVPDPIQWMHDIQAEIERTGQWIEAQIAWHSDNPRHARWSCRKCRPIYAATDEVLAELLKQHEDACIVVQLRAWSRVKRRYTHLEVMAVLEGDVRAAFMQAAALDPHSAPGDHAAAPDGEVRR
jgi:hypothetical protein